LRGEAERIAGLLVVCEQELARVATACQVVGELPAAHGEAGSGRGRIPGGAALALPRQVYSFPLQRAVALEVAETSLRRASVTLSAPPGSGSAPGS
jgi:hypothetical protein